MGLLNKLLDALGAEEAEAVLDAYRRPEVSPARLRMDLDKRAWAAAHALDSDEPSDYELVLSELISERRAPAPPPIDQLTGRVAEPLRRPAPWFPTTPIDKSVHPNNFADWIYPRGGS